MTKIFIKIISVIIIGSIIGAVGFYVWKDHYVTRADISVIEDNTNDETANKALIAQAENNAEAEKKKKNELQVISYIEKNISKIIGLRMSSSEVLIPVRVWFIDSINFYVDYKDSSSVLRRILVNQPSSGSRASYEVLGYFTPGDKGWVLESGRDIDGAVPVKLYEKNESTGEWIIK